MDNKVNVGTYIMAWHRLGVKPLSKPMFAPDAYMRQSAPMNHTVHMNIIFVLLTHSYRAFSNYK